MLTYSLVVATFGALAVMAVHYGNSVDVARHDRRTQSTHR